ncbi:MAG: hypothetical protein QNJ55_31440 [Xenococcus sp. MO_188.B8]|nr:hypothetical protein [Xenococcus sp. MO_188.B8]
MLSTPDFPDSSDGISMIQAFAQLFRLTLGVFAALAGCAMI